MREVPEEFTVVVVRQRWRERKLGKHWYWKITEA
jgi:hypothetical protein